MRAPKLLLALVAVASVATLATPAAWSWPGFGHSSWYNNNIAGNNYGYRNNGYSGVNPMAAMQGGYGSSMGLGRIRQMLGGSNYGYGSGFGNAGYVAPAAYNPMYGSGYGSTIASSPYGMMGGGMMGNGMMGNGMMGNGMMGNGMGMFRHHHHHHYW